MKRIPPKKKIQCFCHIRYEAIWLIFIVVFVVVAAMIIDQVCNLLIDTIDQLIWWWKFDQYIFCHLICWKNFSKNVLKILCPKETKRKGFLKFHYLCCSCCCCSWCHQILQYLFMMMMKKTRICFHIDKKL